MFLSDEEFLEIVRWLAMEDEFCDAAGFVPVGLITRRIEALHGYANAESVEFQIEELARRGLLGGKFSVEGILEGAFLIRNVEK